MSIDFIYFLGTLVLSISALAVLLIIVLLVLAFIDPQDSDGGAVVFPAPPPKVAPVDVLMKGPGPVSGPTDDWPRCPFCDEPLEWSRHWEEAFVCRPCRRMWPETYFGWKNGVAPT